MISYNAVRKNKTLLQVLAAESVEQAPSEVNKQSE